MIDRKVFIWWCKLKDKQRFDIIKRAYENKQ